MYNLFHITVRTLQVELNREYNDNDKKSKYMHSALSFNIEHMGHMGYFC